MQNMNEYTVAKHGTDILNAVKVRSRLPLAPPALAPTILTCTCPQRGIEIAESDPAVRPEVLQVSSRSFQGAVFI
jgi:hypothetical protein